MPRIAILTTAHIHTPNFIKKLKEKGAAWKLDIAGVYDQDAALARKYAEELSAPVIDCWTHAVKDPAIEAVVITGTTAQHNGLAVAAANAKKHMFIEKPLATTSAEANRILTAVKENNIIFQTGHFMRSSAMHRFIKQEIAAGNLGTITRARCSNCHPGALKGWFDKDYRWFFHAGEAGGGGFYDLGCHALDLLIYFFGPAVAATGAIGGQTIKYPNIDEYGEGLVRFANGVTGSIAAGWVDHQNPNFLEITGTEGHLHIHWGQLYYQSSKSSVPGADGKSGPIDKSHFPAELPHAFDLFFEVLAGNQDRSVLIPVEDALNVAKTMEAMYTGDRIGGWVKP